MNLWRGPTDRCSEDLYFGNKLSLHGMWFPNYFSYYCGERRIFLHTQEFINSALAVTSVYVCLFEKSIWLCSVALWAWISTLCLFLWLSEGSCHVSSPACRLWVLPWLQAVRCVFPVQQRPPVLAACRCSEVQVSKELMVLTWKSWLENPGITVSLPVPRKGVACVSQGMRTWSGCFCAFVNWLS